MSILRTLERRGLERRGANQRAPFGDSAPPPPGSLGGSVAGTMVTEQTALQVAAVYGSVSVISGAVSSLPVDLMTSPHRRTGQVIEGGSPLINQPYEEISLTDWWVQFTISLALRGNFFGLIVERDPTTLYPTQVKPIHPDHADVRRNRQTGALEYRFNGQLVQLDNVVHVRLLSVSESLQGLNPVEYLRNVIGLARGEDLYAGSVLQNGAVPSGAIEVEDDLDTEEAKAMKESWMQMQGGIGRAGMPAVLTGGAKFNPVTMKLEDLQFLQARQYDAATISGQIFRVPPHMIGIVDRTTSWGCLPPETQVFTLLGPKPLIEIQAGEEVWSLGRDGMEPRRVVGKIATGYRPLITFNTSGRTIRATSNHHMLVRRWNAPGQGKRGEWKTLLIDAGDVRVGDHFIIPHGFGNGTETKAPNGRELTVEAMEFCGLYVGDGCRGESNQIIICHGNDRDADHMAYYVDAMEREFGVRARCDKAGVQTRFCSKDAVALLETGFVGKAHTKRVPGWVFKLTPELQLAFLRGYLDADGSVQRGRIIYSSVNRQLLEDVRHLCILLGIPTGRVCLGRPAGPMTIRGRTHQSRDKWQLSLSSLSFNGRIGANSPHKAERFVDKPTTRRLRYDANWTPRNGGMPPVTEGWDRTGCTFHKVTKIERSNVAVPVYDLEVEHNHTLVADGVAIGQTGIEQQELGFVRNTLIEYLSRGERMMTELHPPGQFVKFDLSERLRGDRLQRYTAYNMGRLGGWLNADEIRAEEDMAPLPNGEGSEYLVPINSELLTAAIEGAKQMISQQQQPPPGGGDTGEPGGTTDG